MLAHLNMLALHRVALTLSVIALLGLGSGWGPGPPSPAPLAQIQDNTPTICGASVWDNCSWS